MDKLIAQLAQVEQDIRTTEKKLSEYEELRFKVLGALEYAQRLKKEENEEEETPSTTESK